MRTVSYNANYRFRAREHETLGGIELAVRAWEHGNKYFHVLLFLCGFGCARAAERHVFRISRRMRNSGINLFELTRERVYRVLYRNATFGKGKLSVGGGFAYEFGFVTHEIVGVFERNEYIAEIGREQVARIFISKVKAELVAERALHYSRRRAALFNHRCEFHSAAGNLARKQFEQFHRVFEIRHCVYIRSEF